MGQDQNVRHVLLRTDEGEQVLLQGAIPRLERRFLPRWEIWNDVLVDPLSQTNVRQVSEHVPQSFAAPASFDTQACRAEPLAFGVEAERTVPACGHLPQSVLQVRPDRTFAHQRSHQLREARVPIPLHDLGGTLQDARLADQQIRFPHRPALIQGRQQYTKSEGRSSGGIQLTSRRIRDPGLEQCVRGNPFRDCLHQIFDWQVGPTKGTRQQRWERRITFPFLDDLFRRGANPG